jgi:ATP-dependent Clp protease ATP-binding subunit ClpA
MQLERYSEQALKALLRAKEWAVQLNARQISPENLLLGLIEEQGTKASQLLEEFGIDIEPIVQQLVGQFQPTTEPGLGEPVMSPSLQRILRRAESEARLLGDENVDTAHLLLSLLREKGSPAAKLLFRQGVRYEDVRRQLFRMKVEELGEAPTITLPEAFVTDLTEKVLSGEVQPVKFWQPERNFLKRTLLCREQNNPLLLGNHETAKLLLQQFAYDLQFGSLPESLLGRRIIAVDWVGIWLHRKDPDSVLADLLTELQRIEPTPLLLIDDLDELGRSQSMLLKAVQHGLVQAVAVATLETWESLVQQTPSFLSVFSPVPVTEPDEASTSEWLEVHRSVYEEFHRVEIEETALVAAVQLAKQSFPERPLLAAAKRLLDEACAHARCQVFTPLELRSLEDEMERVQTEMRRLLRTNQREQLSELMEQAIALQARIEQLRQQYRATIPKVSAETIQAIAP